MPLIDLPLEKLRDYQGRSTRPADFDAYWDDGLAEMRGVDARVEIRPATFRSRVARCDDLFFTGVGTARVHAKLLRPTDPKHRGPAVCFFHGYTGRSPDWSDLLSYPGRGFTVAALDCRGQAGESEDLGPVRGPTHGGHIIRGLLEGERALLFRSIFLDTAQLAGLVMNLPEVDPARVASNGGSQGGALSIACAALEPKIRKCATMYPFLSDYRRVWEMDQAKDAYAELRTFFRHFDPTHARVEEWFRRLSYIDVQHLAPRIRADVLMATGLMDTVCPPSTQFAVYNKLTCKKDVVIYPDFGHEGLPGWGDRAHAFLDDL